MNTRRNAIWNLTLATILLLGVNLAGAATYQWTGAVDSNWSSAGNWTNGAAPTANTGTDDVWLEPGSPNPPSNQDIVGLYINTLTFNTNTTGFILNGSDIKLKKIVVDDDKTTYTTNTVNCGIIIAANNSWNWVQSSSTRCWLRVNGRVSESGVSAYIPNLNYGYLMLAGSNTFSGGLPSWSGTVKVFEDRNLGAIPGSYVSNFFGGTLYSYVRFGSTGGISRVSVHANRGLLGGDILAAEPNVTVTLNAPLAGSSGITFGGARMNVAGSGTIQLAGNTTNFAGDITVSSGVLSLLHSNALGTAAGKVTLSGGTTLELNGYNLIRTLVLAGDGSYAGFDSSGMYRNSNLTQPSTLSGTINASLNTTPFGGRGDITVTGPITNSAAVKKTGAGTLTLKGANTNFTGAFTSYLGGLTLDFTADNASKIGTNALLTLQQTTLRLIGNASAATMQTCGTIKVTGNDCGASALRLEAAAGQPLTLAAQGIVADNDSGKRYALDIVPVDNAGGVVKLTTTNADGMVSGGGVTWNQSTWAKVVSGVVTGMADAEYSPAFGTTLTNVDLPAGQTTISSTTNALTLRFNQSAGSTLTVNMPLKMGDGTTTHGILVTPKSGPVTINSANNSYIEPYVNKGLVIHQYSTNSLTFNLGIYAGGGVSIMKCGPGEMILPLTNNAVAVYLVGGTLTVSNLTNVGTNSPIGKYSPFYLGNATLKYAGPAAAHNRVFQMNAPATIDASGTGLLEFTASTNATVHSSAGNENYLTLSGSGSGQMDGVLDMHLGGVIKAGAGTWTICGTQYYTGDTIVSNGTLRLSNNCVLARSVRVVSGGTLAGSARIQEDLVMSGTRRVEIRGDSDYDTLAVGYDATLGGTLEISEVAGYRMPANLNINVISAGGTLSGSFSEVTGGSFQVKTSPDGKQLLLSKRYPGFIFYVK